MNAGRTTLTVIASFGLSMTPVAARISHRDVQFCNQARKSILPVASIIEHDIGYVKTARYNRTVIHTADKQTSFLATDLDLQAKRGQDTIRLRFDIKYSESVDCWNQRGLLLYECYETNNVDQSKNSDRPHSTIKNLETRRILSVFAYMATGGQSDYYAKLLSSAPGFIDVPKLRQLEATPAFIDAWYICQTCGGASPSVSKPVSLKGLRVGRSSGATYLVSVDGLVARLPDRALLTQYKWCRRGK